ncbi:glycosyltransferase family 4 protein [Pseudoxanthomonas sp. 22568]|uniref:glycosyltransferase family 4 protein n=1 Tax=Pseudoxanthomonas sp. 22568 TaxID=3453945 RepID=UPI003F87B7FE
MKEKILFISRKWPPAVGGMETYAIELAACLADTVDLDTVVLKGRKNGRPPSLFRYGLFLLKAMYICLFRGRSFNHVVFGDLILFPAALCHRLVNPGARRVVIVYGLDLVYQRRKGALPLLYRLFFSFFRTSQSCFGSIVAISRYTAALAREEGLKNVVVINPCLPTKDERVAETEQLPEVWRQGEGTSRILYFGRVVRRKGALWFASEVMPQLPRTVKFYVVGDSSDTELKRALGNCAGTHCLGRMNADKLLAMIQQADVVVMPNIPTPDSIDVEGFGLVAIETSSHGGLLLASRIDGITDAVVDGVTGRLVEPMNVEAWVKAIERHLDPGPSGDRLDRSAVAEATRKYYSREKQATDFLALLYQNQQ